MSELEKLRQLNKNDFPKALPEQIKFVLRYAILAPSTHNSQPWQFKIVGNMCQVFYNPDLLLPYADHSGRDLYISLGCMLENLITAATYYGIFENVKYFFDDNHVANVYFSSTNKKPELEPEIKAITKRINVRGFFDKQKLTADDFKLLESKNTYPNLKLHFLKSSEQISKLAELTALGIKQAYKSREFRKEMSKWLNPSFSKRREGLHGYSLKIPYLISLFFPWLMRNFNLGKRLGWLNQISIKSAPAMCLVTSAEDNKKAWLETGRLVQRIWLTVETQGMHASVFVASIEIGDIYKQVKELLGTSDRPQFVLCIGYMKNIQKYSPRHNLEDKLL